MLLNHENIKSKVTIKSGHNLNFGQSSLNLTIGNIINNKGRELDTLLLEPSGIIQIISNEYIELPDDVTSYATVKNGLSNKGIMAINIGIIDPGYKGHVASYLINFGREEFPLEKGKVFLRLTFHESKLPSDNKSLKVLNKYQFDSKQYLLSRKTESKANMAASFLNLDNLSSKIEKEVTGKFWRNLILYAALFSIIIVGATYSYSFVNFNNEKMDFKTLKNQIDSLEKKVNGLGIEKENSSEKEGSNE